MKTTKLLGVLFLALVGLFFVLLANYAGVLDDILAALQ